MEFFKPGITYDFMKLRTPLVGASIVVCIAAVVSVFVPGLNFGIDFAGGTELQLHFQGDVSTAELRSTLEEMQYRSPDVVEVAGRDNTYLVRVREVTTLPADIDQTIQGALDAALEPSVESVRVSPGGDKVSVRLGAAADLTAIHDALTGAGVDVRGDVRRFGPESDFRYEADLVGVADQIVGELRTRLGDRGPTDPERVEWVGPRAGEQLRNGAIKALLYAIGFIMVYVAFRFDLRFAPGGVVALIHDALFTVLLYVVFQKEFNLTTVAAILTVIGYSINDTIVVYDRIRENLGRYRDKSLDEIINISTSQTLGRTIITSGTTMMSIIPFFYYGTQAVKDIVFAMMVGFFVGTYSSIYIAAPITEWMDTRFFAPAREARKAELARQRKLKAAAKTPATT
ncbi:MAG: protein translocase subunit SecF [Sandaracinus sp.]